MTIEREIITAKGGVKLKKSRTEERLPKLDIIFRLSCGKKIVIGPIFHNESELNKAFDNFSYSIALQLVDEFYYKSPIEIIKGL